MTVFTFKLFAMITMVCDHVGILLFDNNTILRSVGRCAFLIYAFLMAESFRHLKDKPDRIIYHIQKLLLLFLVTEIPYDYVESGVWDAPDSQCAAFTLLAGFGALALAHQFRGNKKTQGIIYLSAAATTYFVRSNFKLTGALLIIAFYYYLESFESMSIPKRMGALLLIMAAYWPLYIWALGDFCNFATYVQLLQEYLPWMIAHLLIVIPLALYNGELGYRGKAFNFLYSWFYPLHFVVLGFIRFFFL